MAITFKPIASYGDKYKRRAAVAGPDYVSGCTTPKRPQAAASVAGETNFATAMSAVIAEKRRAVGSQKAGDAKWLEGCTVKGNVRFGPGVDAGAKYYEANLAPIHQKVAATTLPIRGPKGSESNFQIPAIVAKAMRLASGKK